MPDIVKRAFNVYLLGHGKNVYQSLFDLLSNAIRFTSEGSLHLLIECIDRLATEVMVRFTIFDTGSGIPKDRQKDIYEAFVKVVSSN